MFLFPPLSPYASGALPVGDGHRLYWEQSGNPDGVAVLFLHGGPGGGTSPIMRRFFDPEFYRIVLFDQRGCGRSTPTGEIAENTTAHLINDIEALRRYLGIERWLIFGGSWGSTLALAYGQAHPGRCLGFVLRGIFLCSRREIDWFLHGMENFFPEAHRAFVRFLPEDERATLLASYYRRLCDPDSEVHEPAARSWYAYESGCSRLIPIPPNGNVDRTLAVPMARLEAHYMTHHGFLAENQLLDGMDALQDHPAVIVQGRYDTVCPIVTARSLADRWSGADFIIVPESGHTALDPGNLSELVRATETMKHRITPTGDFCLTPRDSHDINGTVASP